MSEQAIHKSEDAAGVPLLSVKQLTKHYKGGGWLGRPAPVVKAVDGISFEIMPREIFGLVGESGSGKSTAGRVILQLEKATSGEVVFEGQELTGLSAHEMKRFRRDMQIVFQDPYAALDPRMTVGEFVAEPLDVHRLAGSRAERRERVESLFKQVGLDPRFMSRYPHEFSGGQRQRVNIARAIAMKPRFIIADEPITALDVSIQAQIINLFQELQQELGIAYLFVAHDLSMVRYLCDRVAVMLRGRIVEVAPTQMIFGDPRHAYTRSLLSAVPIPDPRLERKRTPLKFDPATQSPPPDATLKEVEPGHFVLM
jgi:peptide/nickel transport system ATP-binding protein